ncbi:MAG TPA: CpsB/CapC family capsule biosynthesis tyrosine phosphatase [Chloroflexota bacterium]|nr:CpsB/CapC family capsule biosynthesis tyrosine phosphatase [Chloroflexota bacterium]
MIDLHCHILPGVDDGAETLADALAIGQMAYADGIRGIVATPHRRLDAFAAAPDVAAKLLDDVRSVARESGLALDLYLGGEAYIAPDLADQVRSGLALTINGGRYLLLEWPLREYPRFSEEIVFDLQVRGIVPIIAHAERYRFVQQDLARLAGFVERGALVQITAASLFSTINRGMRRTAEELLTRGLAHVIASDSHNVGRRPPILSRARERASELVGPARAGAMVTDAPRQIVENRPVELPEVVLQARRSFWQFWKEEG